MAAGTFARPVYSKYVDRMSLQGHERVLDFGSGAGTPARMLARKLLKGGGQVTCVDVSRVWLETARRRLARYPNVKFKLGEISSLGLPDAAYDVVLVHFVLHDIPAAERPRVVQHLARKLAPGGKLFIREPLEQLARDEIVRLMRENGLERDRLVHEPGPADGANLRGCLWQGKWLRNSLATGANSRTVCGPALV